MPDALATILAVVTPMLGGEILDREGRGDEAVLAEARFKEVWQAADVQIRSSCMCQPGIAVAGMPR